MYQDLDSNYSSSTKRKLIQIFEQLGTEEVLGKSLKLSIIVPPVCAIIIYHFLIDYTKYIRLKGMTDPKHG